MNIGMISDEISERFLESFLIKYFKVLRRLLSEIVFTKGFIITSFAPSTICFILTLFLKVYFRLWKYNLNRINYIMRYL